jgi:DNA repair protein RecO (recombination protein O)
LLNTRAFVLKTVEYSENDLIVHFLPKSGEAFSGIARSAKKSKKRFGGGVLEPFNLLQINYAEEERGGLHLLSEAKLEQGFEAIRKDYQTLQLGYEVLKFLGKYCRTGQSDEQLFSLLGHTLNMLCENLDSQSVIKHFYLRFMVLQGIFEGPALWQEIASYPMGKHKEVDPDALNDVSLEKLRQVCEEFTS